MHHDLKAYIAPLAAASHILHGNECIAGAMRGAMGGLRLVTLAVGLVPLSVSVASALTPVHHCEAAKLKAQGKFADRVDGVKSRTAQVCPECAQLISETVHCESGGTP